METTGAARRPPAATLKREEAARGAREKRAVTAYLRGLQRAGARLARLPVGTDLLSGEDRAAATIRPVSRSTPGAPATTIPGLADLSVDLPVNLPTATLSPPYDYQWKWTKWIHYAPGELSAYADKAAGEFGFDIASSHDSNQVNKSRARAGIGVRYQPSERGLLRIRRHIQVEQDWSLKWKMRVAHTYGWTGLLVQSFDATDNELASTPIDGKEIRFDKTGGGGSLLPAAEFTVTLPSEGLPSLFVDPSRWYAIWVWCGGGIRAAGWQTYLGMNVGSDAASKLDVTVSSIALYFTPIAALSGLR
jgi:hypothetical protein